MLLALVVLFVATAAPSSHAATSLDLSACPPAGLDLGLRTPPFALRTAACTIGFGDDTGTADLRISQLDATGAAMPGLLDHAPGVADWTAGDSMFGACLEAVGAGASTAGSWSVAGDGDCATTNADPWGAVSASSALGTVASTAALQQGSARVRFGARTAAAHAPGAYVAELVVEVVPTTVNTPPNVPALASPTASERTLPAPLLLATFSDPDASDTGLVRFEVCADAGCSSVLQAGSSPSGVANGANGSWTPAPLTPGTQYWWRARNEDAAAAQSSWSATRSFVVNRAPNATALVSPADGMLVPDSTPQLTATFSDPDSADTGLLRFQVCTTSGCGSVLHSGTSAAGVANGADGSWTPPALAAGATYWWRARGEDALGEPGTWSATRSFTVNAPPAAPTLTSPADASSNSDTTPTLAASFEDDDAGDSGQLHFELCTTSNCSAVLHSGSSASGLADGASGSWTTPSLAPSTTYWWRARGEDAAGSLGPWSVIRTFTVTSSCVPANTTPPAVTPPGTVNAGTVLSTTTGTWSCSPSSYTIEWLLCGSPTGDTGTTFATTTSHRGATISTRVTATNADGSTFAYSNEITVYHPFGSVMC